MIRWRHNAHWLLLAALLVTQALAAAHAFDHPALGHADHACAVCAHGQGLDIIPAAGNGFLLALPAHAQPAPSAVRAFIPAVPTGYQSRAPPRLA